jgi:hypothetical protein
MLKSGDFDLLKVGLEYYRRHTALQTAWARHFWKVDGLAFNEGMGNHDDQQKWRELCLFVLQLWRAQPAGVLEDNRDRRCGGRFGRFAGHGGPVRGI